MESIPVVDISALYSLDSDAHDRDVNWQKAAQELGAAFSTKGCLVLKGHNIPVELSKKFFDTAERFFGLPMDDKMDLYVKKGGYAWRGYMPFGGEYTHGFKDHKEGLYFGPEHPADHALAQAPLYGKNQFPDSPIPEMRPTVLEYIDKIIELGKLLSDLISLYFGLPREFMRKNFLEPEPISIVRCFRYFSTPDAPALDDAPKYGIGEHTDFGYLTILNQNKPGLQFKAPSGEWMEVPCSEDSLICNVGDMLDMLTYGRLKSMPHRALTPSEGSRTSLPYFFDFAWSANMIRLPLGHLPPLSDEEKAAAQARWDNTTFNDVSGQWWNYLGKKVQKIFPDLKLPEFENNAAPSSRFAIAIDTSS